MGRFQASIIKSVIVIHLTDRIMVVKAGLPSETSGSGPAVRLDIVGRTEAVETSERVCLWCVYALVIGCMQYVHVISLWC